MRKFTPGTQILTYVSRWGPTVPFFTNKQDTTFEESRKFWPKRELNLQMLQKKFRASKVCFSVYLKLYLHLIYIEFIKNLPLKILILTEQVYTKSKILAKQVAWFYSKLTKRIHPSRQRPPDPSRSPSCIYRIYYIIRKCLVY